MPYSDLFDSGFKDRNRGHFASIVRVALADGKITPEEQKFIDQLAKQLEISEDDYADILENPDKYPIEPPYLQTSRIERLYDLARMVIADHVLGQRQKDILKKFAVALGFKGDIEYLVNKSLSLLVLNVDSETFINEIQNLSK